MNTITIKLNSEIEYRIFIILFSNQKGLNRDTISKRLNIPRTTVYDNLVKLMKRKINIIPYINKYLKHNNKKGRPETIFFIPKGITNRLVSFELDNTKYKLNF